MPPWHLQFMPAYDSTGHSPGFRQFEEVRPKVPVARNFWLRQMVLPKAKASPQSSQKWRVAKRRRPSSRYSQPQDLQTNRWAEIAHNRGQIEEADGSSMEQGRYFIVGTKTVVETLKCPGLPKGNIKLRLVLRRSLVQIFD